jgi:hypothetical protein
LDFRDSDFLADGGMRETTSGACTERVEIMRTLPDAVSCSHRARDRVVEMVGRAQENRRAGGRHGTERANMETPVPAHGDPEERQGVVDDVGIVDRGRVGREEGVREGRALGA